MPKGQNLDFLQKVYTPTKKGWTIETARKFVACVRKEMNNGVGFQWDAKKASKATGMSASGCTFFLQELKKAQTKGWTLERYFAEGRPFRYGKKVLA